MQGHTNIKDNIHPKVGKEKSNLQTRTMTADHHNVTFIPQRIS